MILWKFYFDINLKNLIPSGIWSIKIWSQIAKIFIYGMKSILRIFWSFPDIKVDFSLGRRALEDRYRVLYPGSSENINRLMHSKENWWLTSPVHHRTVPQLALVSLVSWQSILWGHPVFNPFYVQTRTNSIKNFQFPTPRKADCQPRPDGRNNREKPP